MALARPSSRECWAALGIALAAVALRLVRLGALSLAGDEETTALAAAALLEGWPPTLPGGLVYLRGLPFTALESGMLALAGLDEGALRLVPALVAGPRILAMWWLARAFLGPGAALGCAVLLALAPLDVVLSRTARMYSLFATLDLVFVAAVVQFARGAIGGGGLALGALAGAVGVVTHQLGTTHAPVAWAAALAPGLARGRRAALGLAGGFLAATFVGWRLVVQGSYAAVEAVRTETEPVGPAARLGEIQSLLATPAAAVAAAVALGLVAAGTVWTLRRLRSPWARGGSVVAALGFAVGSPFLGGAVWLGLLLLEEASPREVVRRTAGLLAGGAVASAAWAGARLLGPEGGLAAAVRFLLSFPEPNWADLAQVAPGPVALGLAGALALALGAGPCRSPAARLALLVAFLTPWLLTGLETRREGLRYHIHVIPPLVILAVGGATTLLRLVRIRHAAWQTGLAVAVVGLLLRPDLTLHLLVRDHGPSAAPYAGMAPDHREPGEFVRALARSDEWIAAEDPLQQILWAGRVDLWLRRSEDAAAFLNAAHDPPREVYAGSRHVHDLETLRRLAVREDRTVWLITSAEVESAPQHYRTDATQERLGAWEPRAWFVGRDGLTRVYRLEAGDPVPPPPGLEPRPRLSAAEAAARVKASPSLAGPDGEPQ